MDSATLISYKADVRQMTLSAEKVSRFCQPTKTVHVTLKICRFRRPINRPISTCTFLSADFSRKQSHPDTSTAVGLSLASDSTHWCACTSWLLELATRFVLLNNFHYKFSCFVIFTFWRHALDQTGHLTCTSYFIIWDGISKFLDIYWNTCSSLCTNAWTRLAVYTIVHIAVK